MSTVIAPQQTIDERPPESLTLPSLQVPLRDRRDESNKSHSIKEIFVERPFKALPKRFSQTAPTPRARGDGIHHFESKDEDDCEVDDQKKKRIMPDPPGFNESAVDVSLKKQGSMDPDTASVHRRRKRALEQRARKIMGAPSDVPGKRTIDIDGTESTASSSQHSSWVPTRRVEKDPHAKPVYNFAPGPALSQQTMEVRDRAVPLRPWRPARQLSEKRNTLADDEMGFSTTNEWVPSEFYRQHKPPAQAMQIFPTGTPHVISSYPPSQQPQYQEYQQQLHHQQQHLQRQRQYMQKQFQLQQELEAQKQLMQQMQRGKTQHRPHRLLNQPPSIIHTITTATTPSTPTPDNAPSLVHTITTAATPATTIPENDPLKRKSMDSEMAWSDVVVSSTESDTMNGSKIKPRNNKESEESSTVLDSVKNKMLSRKVSTDESKANTKGSEESSTIQDSLISLRKTNKRWSDDSKDPKEAEENSTILDSLKRREGKNASEDVSLKPSSLLKIMNKEFTFENHDDGFDESLLSTSLTQLDIPRNITVIPTIFVRKSGASDITFDMDATRLAMDATRLAIESTLTSDEDLTWGSTIHNSIISQEDAAIAAAAAAAKEINQMNLSHNKDSKNSSSAEANTGGTPGSLLGSGTSGFTGGTIKLNSLTESGVSGLTTSGVLKGGKDAFGNTNPTTAVAEEVGARARRKMEVIPSEVSSYVSNTLSQNRQDSEGDSRSSWHHRSNITTTSTMVSTKKVANKKNNKFKPRRSSTSTLPSIGSIIPEESWDYADAAYDIEEEDDEDSDEDDDDDDEILIIDDEDDDNMGEAELERKLSSILEVASRDRSGTNSRDISREFSVEDDIETSVPDSVDIESGEESDDNKESSSDLGRSNRKPTWWEYCACLEIRCFELRDDGTRGKFHPTMGTYIVTFLVLILLTVWTGIGFLLFRVLRS